MPSIKLEIAKTRPRHDTTTLLPSFFNPADLADVTPDCPIPELNTSLYTAERLQKSLAYAYHFLKRRDISSRSELFMHLFKEEVKNALTAETSEREMSTAMVMTEEVLIQKKRFLRPLQSFQTAELEDCLLKLRELQYYIRYDDYLKIVPTRLRLHASENKSENWQLLSGAKYWSNIAVNLKKEQEARQEALHRGSVLDSVNLNTTIAVAAACDDLGISEELAVWTIMEYGERNLQVHRDLVELRREGKFGLFAKILCADRDELDATFSHFKPATDMKFLKTIIQSQIDEWFDSSDDPRNLEVWIPTTSLRQFYKDALDKTTKPTKQDLEQVNEARAPK